MYFLITEQKKTVTSSKQITKLTCSKPYNSHKLACSMTLKAHVKNHTLRCLEIRSKTYLRKIWRLPKAQLVLTWLHGCFKLCFSSKHCRIRRQSSVALSSHLLSLLNGANRRYRELKALNLIRCGYPEIIKHKVNDVIYISKLEIFKIKTLYFGLYFLL